MIKELVMKCVHLSATVFLALSGLMMHTHASPGTCSNAETLGPLEILGLGLINQIAYHPDGMRLAVASSIGIVIWDQEKGAVDDLLLGHTGKVDSVAWPPDGSKIAGRSVDHTIKVWEADSGALL